MIKLGDGARKLLSVARREHVPAGPRPHVLLHRKGAQWGVAMLHGGAEVHWWPLDQARRTGAKMIELANLGARPGELPADVHG